jgi:hypothetical protein
VFRRLKRIWTRVMQGEDERSIDNVDGLTTAINHAEQSSEGGAAPMSAPPGWVPSQQDWGSHDIE